jgi:branched-chain amino acid transport system substrate-binding protein
MDSGGGDEAGPGSEPKQPDPSDSVTRGFLFADLRAYTDFVETHGAAAAASLLERYRALVRAAIQPFGGAEIKTEGDSFYVVFNSVSAAVRCGLVITRNAMADAVEHADEPIRVGIGIHAGETVEAGGGYVGSPVNIAARICSQAGPNEVFVSETVRALTQTVLPVRFEARGRRQLKGIAEPVALYAVIETDAAPWAKQETRPVRRARRLLLVGGPVAAVVAVALVAALVLRSSPAPALPPGTWRIGVDLPLSGDIAFRGTPLRNAVELAINDTNAAGGIDGSRLVLRTFDDAGPTGQDPELGEANARNMVADPMTIAMIGPSGSSVAHAVIPVTNEAGLLECSPANTAPSLTKPRYGALDVRSAHPNTINFVRIAPSDDIQAPALASFAYQELDARVALVIDDAGADGRVIADGFQQAYTNMGGRVIRMALNSGADPSTVLASLSQATDTPGVVFFGGFTGTGAVSIRQAMIASGHGEIPFLSWDGIFDGSGADDGSYIQGLTAADSAGSYVSHATQPPTTHAFVEAYRQAYGEEPDEYASAAYACVQVIVQSLRAVAADRPSSQGLREALRAYVVDPEHHYDTVVGDLAFDVNGDSIHQYVTFYRIDPTAVGGLGDWVSDTTEDYGPAP